MLVVLAVEDEAKRRTPAQGRARSASPTSGRRLSEGNGASSTIPDSGYKGRGGAGLVTKSELFIGALSLCKVGCSLRKLDFVTFLRGH